MGKYWKLIGHSVGEATSYEAAAGAGQTSPYTPIENARLIGLRVMEGSAAVTTVTTVMQWKLTCSTFKPNSIEVALAGSGLHTAPRAPAADQIFIVDQPVMAGVPITVETRILGAYTDVTNECFLWGLFES